MSNYGMGHDYLRGLVAPGLASLFLLLGLCAFVVQTPVSVGIRVPIMRTHHNPDEPFDCDGRLVVLRLTKNRSTWLNQTEIPDKLLEATVASLMRSRADRIAYMIVDRDLAFSEFVRFEDRITGATDSMHVVVLSDQALNEPPGHKFDFCDLVDPPKDFSLGWVASPSAVVTSP